MPASRRLLMKPMTLRRVLWSCALLAGVLLAIVLLALRLGAVPFSFGDLGQNLWWLLTGQSQKVSTDFRLIMVDIRLPRILLGIVVGASLSVAGTAFQALLRNPLADPYVLGASSGASLGAILTLIVQPYIALPLAIAVVFTPIGAFVGAAAVIAAVYFLGRRDGQLDSNTLLLSGIVSGSFLSAIIMFLISTLAGRGDCGAIWFGLMADFRPRILRRWGGWLVRDFWWLAAGINRRLRIW